MAKVVISVDTSKKEFTVKVDGTVQDGVNYASVSKDGQYFYLEMVSHEDAGDDLKKMVRLSASKKDESWAEAKQEIDLVAFGSVLLGERLSNQLSPKTKSE